MKSKSIGLQTYLLTYDDNLVFTYLSSMVIALLMAVASIFSLFNPGQAYPIDALRKTFLANDVVNLFIGLPILLGAVWLSWRGKLVGLLFWPGALMYILYNYIAYIFSIPLSWIYLLYLSIVTISVYTLIGLVASINGESVQLRLAGVVPEKLSGGIIIGLGSIILLRVFAVIVTVLISKSSISPTEFSVLLSDFLLSPAWIIGGLLLWRRKALGYVSGLALLFQASMLFIGLIAFLLLQPLMTAAPFAIVDVIVVLIMGLICFIPFGMYVRKIGLSS